ncbi:Glucose-6-phosphate isomerase [gamma proteobacterium IMCC2047]|nr:Glucose-6-phosphate isomerase [gamma proteobacterium IMCC2047]
MKTISFRVFEKLTEAFSLLKGLYLGVQSKQKSASSRIIRAVLSFVFNH